MPTVDLTPRLARESKPGAKNTILFDKTLPGFGLRIHPSGRKVYIVQARIEGRSRRLRIARHGEMELTEARRRARDMLGRIRADENPADDIRREKETPTFRLFADEYLRRCDPHWKPSGRKTVRIYLKARILPTFGRMALDRIGPEDVAAWFDAASRDRPGAANRAFEILRAMMFRAEEWGLRERGSNPCLGIAKNPRNNVGRVSAVEVVADSLARNGATIRNDRGYDTELDHRAAVRYASLAALLVHDAAAAREGGTLKFTMELARASEAPVTVDYETADGTATARRTRRPIPIPGSAWRRVGAEFRDPPTSAARERA